MMSGSSRTLRFPALDSPHGSEASRLAAVELINLVGASKGKSAANANLPMARALLTQCPDSEAAHEAYITILDRSHADPDMALRWQEFHRRWPANRTGLRFAARGMARQDQIELAVRLIEQRFDLVSGGEKVWIDCANLLADAELTERSFELFDQMLGSGMDSATVRVAYAKRLKQSGLFLKANQVLAPVRDGFKPGTRNHALAAELSHLAVAFPAPAATLGSDLRLDLMLQIVAHYAAARRSLPPYVGLRKLCFLTGSLAIGGAEQQMARIATAFSLFSTGADRFQVATETVTRGSIVEALGDPGVREVSVLVRSLDAVNRQNVLLDPLLRSNVSVHQAEPGHDRSAPRDQNPFVGYSDQDRSILENLPQSVSRGVAQFYPVMKLARYDTVSIWQDGAVSYGAIPALMAGVRNITIVFRGLPPNIRRYLDKPEFAPLFAALAKVNGVTLAANSEAAAREYEAWLKLAPGTVRLIPNGVAPLDPTETAADAEVWRAFDRRTADAQFTVGMVGRLVHVKRPLDWVKVAAAIHQRNPRTRFVIVGDGALEHDVRQMVRDLGLADRVLWTGYSERVGYWLGQMNALLMLSRFEGLPNVLIEAQASGVPVISTPAGGAVECFRDGVTGAALPFLESVDHAVAAEVVLAMLRQAQADPGLPDRARAHAQARFSITQSMCAFLRATIPSHHNLPGPKSPP